MTMRVGITGHQRLKDPSLWDVVRMEMEKILAHLFKPLIGITSLAVGADQLFAEIILQQSGTFEAIIPFEGYEFKFTEGEARNRYRYLVHRASQVEVLSKTVSEEQAYFEAGKKVVDLADVLVAVWDGKPAAGLGGTADVVAYAQQQGKQVIHLNPTTMR
jgi:hypothetical protein